MNPVLLAFCAAFLPWNAGAQESAVEFHGAGWFQFGRVERSSGNPSEENYYNKNWMQNAGGQVNSGLKIDEHWDAGLGLGVVQVHLIRGNQGNGNWYPFYVPYVAEARVTYATSFTDGDKFRLSLGSIPYGYNPDAKNLGVYLLKGYVYPGALVSGFGNVFGAVAGYQKGAFRNDLILNSEMEDRPLYDYSIADVVSYRIVPGFEVGAGVNFYRVLAQNSDLTSPGRDCESDLGPKAVQGQENPCYIIVRDTAGIPTDTVTGSLAGTKLMARFSIDPKALFGFSGAGSLAFGKNDLLFYGEAAILGTKDYPVIYDDIFRRMPVMVGFNFPAFGLLDYLSVEVEYYASKNSSDNLSAQNGTWIPPVNPAVNNARDDWKWSAQAAKTLWGSAQLSAQVANDHLRLGGSHDKPSGVEALTTPKDWYWTCKLAYFF
jgi:hypothetical protein